MAARNLTRKFETYRSQSLSTRIRSNSHSHDEHDNNPLLASGSRADDSDVVVHVAGLPPVWVDIVDRIQNNIKQIKENLKILSLAHQSRLKVSFAEEEENEQDQEIEILTQKITHLLKSCENDLKRIATVGNMHELAQDERIQRLNVMRAFAVELQQLSKTFRNAQKDFLIRLKNNGEGIKATFFDEVDAKNNPLSLEDAADRGFTGEQLQRLREVNEMANMREKEIIRIAQNVNELAQIFRELNCLVIEQGSLLDRIDYNLEQTSIKVEQGTTELVEAEKISGKMRTLKCIIALLILVVLLIVILSYKLSRR